MGKASTRVSTAPSRRVRAVTPPAAAQVAAEEVRVFISYAHADSGIATALYEELDKIDHNRIRCFLDTKTIGSGKNWKKRLDEFLQSADWLVCIYTGEQSEFCGYEIGVFEKVNNLSPEGDDSPVICLHDVPTLPTVFQPHQNRAVVFPPEGSVSNTQSNEVDFYLDSPIAKFFSDLYAYKSLYVARDASENQRQTQTLSAQVRRITEAFKAARGTDVLTNTPIQLQLDVSVESTKGKPLLSIPEDAKVTGTFASLALFGLMPPMQNKQLPATTWGELKRACCSEYRPVAPWIERLERDMLDTSSHRVPRSMEATLASNEKIYRAILSRHILFENGACTFEILFVETLPRQFLGKKHTSLMLAGIVLAARFRFAYLEDPKILAEKFDDFLSADDFQSNCWQFHYDLDRLRHEAIELGILDPVAFINAFGEERRGFAENLLKVSNDSRLKLYEALPVPGERIADADRPRVKAAILEYCEKVGGLNSRFLIEALEILKNELLSQTKMLQLHHQLSEAPSNTILDEKP
jgi:hypothetical protein